MRKPKILWQGEASYLNTGYATYTKEVLSRLYKSGKYEIAEFGIYGHWNDPKRWELPWKFYGNIPDKDNQQEYQHYHSRGLNQFGCWRINDILLDYKPDIVCSISDLWMTEHIERSPFRDFYYWINMPPIDSTPNYEQWLYTYRNADKLLGYTEFCRDYLLEYCDKEKFCGLAPPGADFEHFHPIENRKQVRAQYGFEDDIFIVGTVMRNMARKLYPDLLEAFKIFVDKYPEQSEKTYLHLHTSYPDLGWDIPKLIKDTGLGHKVLFTYVCIQPQCQHVFPSFFNGPLQACPKCNKFSANLPNSKIGLTREQIATVLHWFDLYVQYSMAEAVGMPLIEAAACGIPICAVDYSGMASVLKNVGGHPIKVQRFFTEPGSHAKRALPDNEKFADFLNEFLTSLELRTRVDYEQYKTASPYNKPKSLLLEKDNPQEIFEKTKEHYSWDKTAKAWETCIDTLPLKNERETWYSPFNYRPPYLQIPQGLTNEQFSRYIIANVWGRPDKLNSYTALRLCRDLNYQTTVEGCEGLYYSEMLVGGSFNYSTFNREQAVNEMLKLNQWWKEWEEKRVGIVREDKPTYIRNA